MPSLRRPLVRFGLVLSAAVLGLSVATTAAVAEPADTAPPAGETTETAPVDPPASVEPPEVTEPATPPASAPEEPVAEEPAEEPGTGEPAEDPTAVTQSIQDIQVTTTFDKASYRTGETITMTVTVTNTGTQSVTATASTFTSIHPDAIRVDYPNPFDSGPFTLGGGASLTRVLTGAMGNPDATTATLYAWVYDATGATQAFAFTVPVKQTVGHAAGTVYVDTNHNEKFDDGEGRGGVTLTWSNTLHTESTVTVTTDQNGRFTIDALPTGRYFLTGGNGSGLTIAYQNVTVDESGVDVLLRAYEPLTDLGVDLEFTKDTYGRTEAPVVRVTLTNSGDFALTGIVARCDRGGFGTSLDGDGPGWGALTGDGVTVAAHSTLVLDVTEPMPADAYEYGHVTVGCDFGHRNVEDFDHDPSDSDRAAVPGRRGDLTGTLVNDTGAGVADARLVLVPDEEGGCPVAETTTDAAGTFAFRQLPVGDYQLYLFPPSGWHDKYDNPTRVGVVGTYESRVALEVVPGDAPAPTLPDCPTGGPGSPAAPPAPAPQARTAPVPLAETGASIAGPGVLGLLALLTGAVTVLTARRRETA